MTASLALRPLLAPPTFKGLSRYMDTVGELPGILETTSVTPTHLGE